MSSDFLLLSSNYAQVRFRWCRSRLFQFLRRWGIYILVGAVALGSSATDPVATMSGLVSMSVLPLFWSMQYSPWGGVGALLGYGLAGIILCWSMRAMLWPVSWQDIELSLPISRKEQRCSDLIVVSLALAPFYLLCLAGVLRWITGPGPDHLAQQLLPLGILAAGFAISLTGGVRILSQLRQAPRRSVRGGTRSSRSWNFLSRLLGSPRYVLMFLPLARGPAKRAASLLKLSLLLFIPHMLIAGMPAKIGWWLACFSLLAQLLTTRLMGLVRAELEPLHAQCSTFPISLHRLRRERRLLALFPAMLGFSLLLPLLLVILPEGRFALATVYVLLGMGANLLEVVIGGRSFEQSRMRPATRAALWLAILALQIALASEIAP